MDEVEFFNCLQQFCKDNKLEIKGSFHVGKSIAVTVYGENGLKLFRDWLCDNNIQHTLPTSYSDGFMSYITL